MELILFAFASLVILIPVMFLIPIGISFKGKLGLIPVSFLLANVGHLAIIQFTLWQTAIILLLLVGLTAFMLNRKFGDVLFKQVKVEIESSISPQRDITEQLDDIHEEDINTVPVERITEEIGMVQVNENIEVVKSVEKNNQSHSLEEVDEIEDIDDEVSFFLNREEFTNVEVSPNYLENVENVNENPIGGDLSDIERMLFNDEYDDLDTNVSFGKVPFTEKIDRIKDYTDYVEDKSNPLDEVAVSIEKNNELEGSKHYQNDEIPVLNLNKVVENEQIENSSDMKKSFDWDDEIEPIREFKK